MTVTDAEIEALLPMIDSLAAKAVAASGIWSDREDFTQAAREAAVIAAQQYDPNRGMTVRSYLYNQVQFRLVDHQRNMLGRNGTRYRSMEVPADPIAHRDVSKGDGVFNPTNSVFDPEKHRAPCAFSEFEDESMDAKVLADAIVFLEETLPPHEFAMVAAYLREGKMKAAGQACGVTEGRVSQVFKVAVNLLSDNRHNLLGETDG
jgi:RNA polymerase sigma factor (sigma-70 family)